MITTQLENKTLIIRLDVDSLDASNADAAKLSLNALDREGVERAVLDLSKVEFIDSSGIGAILSFYKHMGQKVSLRNPTPTVLSVLELLRLHRVFEIEAE